MRFALVAGATATGEVDGISAAGADPAMRRHTPAADAELVEYGRTIRAPAAPVSPSGCPTPAIVTRAVRELLDFDLLCVDGGLAAPAAAPTVDVGAEPGGDVRDPEPVPNARDLFEAARRLGRGLPDDELFVGESVPGGTTTALGVLRALGEPYGVSSSLPENPLDRKRAVVESGLDASDLSEGDLAGAPIRAVGTMGDPVLATVAGLAAGAADDGTEVTLAGGTQMVAAGALLRHAGVGEPLRIATTSFVDGDPSVDLEAAAAGLDLDLVVTDPGFDRADHVGMARYRDGEAKEGVGMGGALFLAEREGVSTRDVRERIPALYDRVVTDDGP